MISSPRALKLTKENVDRIISEAKVLGFDLNHLPDNMEYTKELIGDDLYLILDGSNLENNLVFTEFSESDFRKNWKFATPELENYWTRIERVS